MDRLQIPWMFVGPSGSGKLTKARQWVEAAHKVKLALPLEARTFSVGDGYEARVLASPYHFEIDIPNLSMQDKQIIGDLLTTFFSSGDVLNSLLTNTRKLVILRRAHALSLPAAIRVRGILQQYVMPAEGGGMLWITAREMTGPLALLEDTFVRHRVPRTTLETWNKANIPPALQTAHAWERCEGRLERAADIVKFFPDGVVPAWPRRVQDYYDEMVEILIRMATSTRAPDLDVVVWIRGRVYQALSLCQTGPDIIDSCAAAIQRHAALLEPSVFWKAMTELTRTEPHTSYRTPLSLESGIFNLYDTIRAHTKEKQDVPVNGRGMEPVTVHATEEAGELEHDGEHEHTNTNTNEKERGKGKEKKPVNRRAAPRKKTGSAAVVG